MDHKKRDTLIQFIKFNIVGIINTVLNYLIYSLLIYSGVGYRISLAVDYALGIAVSFILNKKYTFKKDEKTNPLMVIKMIFSYVCIFFINVFLLEFMVEKINVDLYVGQFFSIIIIVLISFVLQKLYVFKA